MMLIAGFDSFTQKKLFKLTFAQNRYSPILLRNIKIAARSGLLLDSEHSDALEKIRYLESKHQRTAEEEMAVSEAPQFGHQLKDVTLDEAQPAHFETTLTPVNDATMKVGSHILLPST